MTLDELFQHGWTLTALAIALERPDGDGEVERAARDVVRAAGLGAALEGDTRIRRADLRSTLAMLGHLARAAGDPAAPLAGWRSDDPVQVEGQGLVSEAATARLIGFLAQLPGVGARLETGAAVLDIGAGAAGVGLAFAARYPKVRVVGVEISPVAAAAGRARIAAAGLGDRLEMREQGGEDVTDVDTYDLAWVAQMFIPDAVLDRVLAATVRAMKPGATLVTAAVCAPGDGVPEAVSRLRGAAWSGSVRLAEDVVARLAAAGLPGATIGPRPPGSTMSPILGRKPA